MNTFLVIAAFMAAIAAAAVALPLLRDRQSRLLGAAAALAVVGRSRGSLSAVVELELARAGRSAGPQVPTCSPWSPSSRSTCRTSPDDLAGWLMLGRSYLALQRMDDAILAYDHAHRLDATNVGGACSDWARP